MSFLRSAALLGFVLSVALAPGLAAARSITDQLHRQVEVPDIVNRVVILQHQTLDIAVELGAADKIVGVLRSWQGLIPGLERVVPALSDLPTPGDLTSVNIEELLKLAPDVVFVTNYAPEEMIEQISSVGIPVVAISLSEDAKVAKPTLNPVFDDDDAAYTAGLKQGVELIGDILGARPRADALLDYVFSEREQVQIRLQGIKEEERIRLYMANPELKTYGTGKYTGVIMARSGGINVVAEAGVKGATTVSIEDVLHWNPQVIFVQDRYAPVAGEIRNSPAWQPIEAVGAGRIHITPEYVKPWGYPLPEAMALGELWMAKTLYPERFTDIDMQAKADAFYERFYGQPYVGPH